MRVFVATVLLLLRTQPLLGAALCQFLSGGDGDRMEVGCPMPAAEGSVEVAPGATSEAAVTSVLHECVFAEICAPTPPAVGQAESMLIADLPERPLVSRPSAPTPPTEGRAPPVPPPRS